MTLDINVPRLAFPGPVTSLLRERRGGVVGAEGADLVLELAEARRGLIAVLSTFYQIVHI